MAVKPIYLFGNPELHYVSDIVLRDEEELIKNTVEDLHDTLVDFREKYDCGRAIAAPQIGVMKRIIYMYIDKPCIIINPIIDRKSDETIELWDDCMSFPELLVKVKRHKTCRISFFDEQFKRKEILLENDLAELLQHENDHLDGVLAVSRAIDGKSFAFKN